MKQLILAYIGLLSCLYSFSQDGKKLYNPNALPEKDLAQIAEIAKKEKKHILILAGGNWCARCLTFDQFCKANSEVDSILKADFLVYHLNYSTENENKAVFAKFGYPQRFGFPVLLVLNDKGERLHTQETEYLEQGNGYSRRKVFEFLQAWNRNAVQPGNYK